MSFVFDYGSFVSVEKDTLKRKSLQFEYKGQDYFGMISGKVDTKKENYYVELVSKDFDNIYKNRSLENHLFSFKNIPPGSYYIRTIIDTNKNGRWDKGNIIKNIEPELEKNLIKINRQFLHAKTLGFIHPKKNKEMIFNSNLPRELEKIIKILRNT